MTEQQEAPQMDEQLSVSYFKSTNEQGQISAFNFKVRYHPKLGELSDDKRRELCMESIVMLCLTVAREHTDGVRKGVDELYKSLIDVIERAEALKDDGEEAPQ